MRYSWLLLSLLSIFLCLSPAEAARLLFWRFDRNQNQLIFTTDVGVQPKAQLISNPTRLVIDLPGIVLGRPTANQAIGGAIRSVRVGQFDNRTTRIVVELAPGYTMDPQKIRFRGASPREWSVELPDPERLQSQSSPSTRTNISTTATPVARVGNGNDVRVTRNGFFLDLGEQSPKKIEVRRSRDRRTIDVDIEGLEWSNRLAAQTLSVNQYGVSSMAFSQVDSEVARLTLTIDPKSPDWQASISRFGGLVLVPTVGAGVLQSNSASVVSAANDSRIAIVESIDMEGRNLLVRANRAVSVTSRWNAEARLYEITIPNARLAEDVSGPDLSSRGPIAELRLRQQDSQTVVLLVKPSRGIRVSQIDPLRDSGLRIGFQRGSTLSPPRISVAPPATPPTISGSNAIPVPPPSRNSPVLPRTSPPSTNLPRIPNGRVLVVVDPGHGGKDPGAIGIGGLQEKDVNIDISLRLARILEQQGVKVILTRSNDTFISLQGRTVMANRARADLFVSIHANAVGGRRPDVNGFETYYYSSGGELARTIHRSVLQSINIRDRRVRTARFYVLRNSSMPAVLVETGFVTGREDSANLRNPQHRQQMAEAIARGILQYIQRRI
ncbi:N-acetylmuramoyl-L-alanine amidase [Lusitaniella coriacea]|uniref:N-acetylmuramoyl-L-alanine amidase n=1 Tax=Lusitaniella coriacea TaxID=1983105 RepID=UPI003CE94657